MSAPALAPEEWAEWIGRGNHFATRTVGKPMLFVENGRAPRKVYVGTQPLTEPEEEVAVAAILLYESGRGFTWDDVDLLGGPLWTVSDEEFLRKVAALANLTERLASLLPPRPLPTNSEPASTTDVRPSEEPK